LAFDNDSYTKIWDFQSLGNISKLPFELNHLRFATRNHLSAEQVTVGRILHPSNLEPQKESRYRYNLKIVKRSLYNLG
jgi:hypothetical protein